MKIIDATVEATLPFGRDKVRHVVAAPALIVDWHPGVDRISIFEQKGLLYRKAHLKGWDAEIVEKCWAEPNQDEFHFQAVQGFWSDCLYRSKMQLEDADEGCKLIWQGRLMKADETDEKDQMQAFYESGIRGLEAFLAEQ